MDRLSRSLAALLAVALSGGVGGCTESPTTKRDVEKDAAASSGDATRPSADAGACADAGTGKSLFECLIVATPGCVSAEGDDAYCLQDASKPCDVDCRGVGVCRGMATCAGREGQYCGIYDNLFLCRNGAWEGLYDGGWYEDAEVWTPPDFLPSDGPGAPPPDALVTPPPDARVAAPPDAVWDMYILDE